MKKYSIRELENLLLQPGVYSYMTRSTHANEFYEYNMKCATRTDKYRKYTNYNNMAYEIDGYKITQMPGGFVMLWFPDGSRCMNESQEKLKELFAKCVMFYTQQEIGKINSCLDGDVIIQQSGNSYVVSDGANVSFFRDYFMVQKKDKKYELQEGLGFHVDTSVIPQEYIRDLYADIQDVCILRDLADRPIKFVEENSTHLDLHRRGIQSSWSSYGYNIKYANKPGIYKIRYSFEEYKNNTGELVLPNGRIIPENRRIKDTAMTEIFQNTKDWLYGRIR